MREELVIYELLVGEGESGSTGNERGREMSN